MAKAFDPYYKWLSIPPSEQPPNHYRLLGVPLFTSDPDVVENAADRQMAHVRSLASGKYAAFSQKLLNELAAARVCLLNPEKKSRYDTELRQRTSASASQPAAIPVARAVSLEPKETGGAKQLKTRGTAPGMANAGSSAGSQLFEFDADKATSRGSSQATKLRGKRKSGPALVLIGLLLLAVPALGYGLWMALQKPANTDSKYGTEVARREEIDFNLTPRESDQRPALRPSRELPTVPVGVSLDPMPKEINQTPENPDTPSPFSPETSFPENKESNTSGTLPEEALARTERANPPFGAKLSGDEPEPEEETVQQPIALPEQAELEMAQQKVREAYGISSDDELASRENAENISDAAQMLAQAKSSAETAAIRCALLIESIRLSLLAQKTESLTTAVDALQTQFKTDGWTLVAEAASSLPELDDETSKSEAAYLMQLAQTCARDEAYPTALKLAEAAQELVSGGAGRVIDPALRKQASEEIDLLTSLAELHTENVQALETLKNSTDEYELASAHLAVGQYLVFRREEWEAGCEHLAKGSDSRLAAAAQADLEGQQPDEEGDNASDAKQRGDLWFNIGQRGKPFMKVPSQRRAAHWYTTALPDLKGRDQQSVERRLSEIDRELGPASQLLTTLTPTDSWARSGANVLHQFEYNGEKMLNSLWTNPTSAQPSYATFDLAGKFVGLKGIVSIDDSARGKIHSDLVFTIFGDGRPLWRSAPVGKSQLAAPFEVSIKNVQKLTMQCESTGGDGYVHGVWLEPLLLRR